MDLLTITNKTCFYCGSFIDDGRILIYYNQFIYDITDCEYLYKKEMPYTSLYCKYCINDILKLKLNYDTYIHKKIYKLDKSNNFLIKRPYLSKFNIGERFHDIILN